MRRRLLPTLLWSLPDGRRGKKNGLTEWSEDEENTSWQKEEGRVMKEWQSCNVNHTAATQTCHSHRAAANSNHMGDTAYPGQTVPQATRPFVKTATCHCRSSTESNTWGTHCLYSFGPRTGVQISFIYSYPGQGY